MIYLRANIRNIGVNKWEWDVNDFPLLAKSNRFFITFNRFTTRYHDAAVTPTTEDAIKMHKDQWHIPIKFSFLSNAFPIGVSRHFPHFSLMAPWNVCALDPVVIDVRGKYEEKNLHSVKKWILDIEVLQNRIKTSAADSLVRKAKGWESLFEYFPILNPQYAMNIFCFKLDDSARWMLKTLCSQHEFDYSQKILPYFCEFDAWRSMASRAANKLSGSGIGLILLTLPLHILLLMLMWYPSADGIKWRRFIVIYNISTSLWGLSSEPHKPCDATYDSNSWMPQWTNRIVFLETSALLLLRRREKKFNEYDVLVLTTRSIVFIVINNLFVYLLFCRWICFFFKLAIARWACSHFPVSIVELRW